MWFLATSFLFLTTFFLEPFFYDLQKWQYQNSEKKQFLGFSRINLCLFNPSLPGLVSLLILNHCKLLPLSFVFIFSFLSFFLSHRRSLQAWSVISALTLSPVLACGTCWSDPAADPAEAHGCPADGPTCTPVLIAHPLLIRTDGPALLRLAAGLGLVLHNPGTTHSCTLLFKGALSILCLPGGKRGKAKPRLSEQLPREQKYNADVLKHSDGRQSQPSGKHHTQQCKDFIPTFLVRYDFVCFVGIKLYIS